MSLAHFNLENIESLKNLVHLSSLHFKWCEMPDSLSFLTQENVLPHLTKLVIDHCHGLSTSSFAPLAHAPNLHVLEVFSLDFDNDCLQYLENMVHLRKLDLSYSNINGDKGVLEMLMQNLFQLEDLNLCGCLIGKRGAVAGSLYSTHSRLRVLNLRRCDLVDDDLHGIDALKNTLEALDLSDNYTLTNEGLMHLKSLVKLKKLNLSGCHSVDNLLPIKDCLNLQELNVSCCLKLTDDSFKIFREEPNSFPNLHVLDLTACCKLTEEAAEHLSKNNHVVYQLKELHAGETHGMLTSLRNNICHLKGLQRLEGIRFGNQNKQRDELMQRLKNLEEIPR